MPLQIPAGYAQLNMIYQVIGGVRPSEVTIGFKGNPASNAADIAVIANTLFTAVNRPGAAARMSRDWTFLGVRCMLMTESGPTVGEQFTTVTGTGAWDALPSNLAVLIRKNTGLGGRANRGRMFVPPTGVSETGANQLGAMTAPARTQIQSDWDGWFTAMKATVEKFYLFHNETAIPSEVTGLAVQSLMATQRRRMRK